MLAWGGKVGDARRIGKAWLHDEVAGPPEVLCASCHRVSRATVAFISQNRTVGHGRLGRGAGRAQHEETVRGTVRRTEVDVEEIGAGARKAR
jgi:hypothetical protein